MNKKSDQPQERSKKVLYDMLLLILIYYLIFIGLTLIIPDLLPVSIFLAGGIGGLLALSGGIHNNKFIETFGLLALGICCIFVTAYVFILMIPHGSSALTLNPIFVIFIDIIIIYGIYLQIQELKKSLILENAKNNN